jgi:aminomethyltransferase
MERAADIPTVASNKGPRETGREALKTGASLLDRTLKALRLTGKDPVGMLNAVLTNEVPKGGNRGAYALLLDPKGRVQTDLRVLKGGGGVLVLTEEEGYAAAQSTLRRYAPFSRVEVEELPDREVLGLYGPRAPEMLGVELEEHESSAVGVGGAKLLAVGVEAPVSGLDLVGPAGDVEKAREYLLGAGATPMDRDAYEAARVAAGVPRFGADLAPENFPAEAGLLDRAVSLKKGCYPGQETVARMHYRGSPNKRLYRLATGGKVPAGVEVSQNGKAVGRITSVSPLPEGRRTLALGYLSRSTDLDGPLRAGDVDIRVLGQVQ